ncbi:nucleoside phosphorylase domain-containing protein [Trichoderma austrokoningii]
MPALSQVAKTNVTSISAKVDYPRPPRLKEGLRYFQCPCCCQMLPSMFREGTKWKKHLAEDICPYTCFIDDCICPERLYASRKDWLRHVEKDHSRCWECLPCRKHGQPPLVFTSVEDFIKHTNTHHGDSITEDQHPTLISAVGRPAPFGITQCPLCDQTGPADSDELLDHIAEHVHSFSLRSLPWPRDELDTRRDEPSFFDDHDYFEEGSSGQSYNVSSNSARDNEDVASLSSNASPSQRGFSTDMDNARAEPIVFIQEPFRYQHYRIAIICASSLEVKAVCTLFAETYEESLKLLDDDGPDEYALGCLEDHYVVVACRRSNHLGGYPISITITKIRRNFPGTKWFVSIGVGGGIPSKEHDIRLGDVVVSTGIVRLDMSDMTTQGGDKMKIAEPPLRPSGPWLAVNSASEFGPSFDPRILERNVEHIARVWPSYQSPGEDRDKLFPANSKHTFGQETCENCKDAQVLRKYRPPGPQVYYGLTASVNGTIKDAEIRDRIASETGVLCFEREDGFNDTETINYVTILGICDYTDSHSNNEWRGYAAATAAAYTETLLRQIPRLKYGDSRES